MILDALKGLNITDPKFYIPVIICAVLLLIVVNVAKKLAKLAIFIAVVVLALLVYFNLPSINIDGKTANIKVSGKQYSIDVTKTTIKSEKDAEGKTKVYLVSTGADGKQVKIELPFSKDYAERFIMAKIREKIGATQQTE